MEIPVDSLKAGEPFPLSFSTCRSGRVDRSDSPRIGFDTHRMGGWGRLMIAQDRIYTAMDSVRRRLSGLFDAEENLPVSQLITVEHPHLKTPVRVAKE